MTKLIATIALAAGMVAGAVSLAPVASVQAPNLNLVSVNEPMEGHYGGCSGEHDGSYCWSNEGGVIQHLNMM